MRKRPKQRFHTKLRRSRCGQVGGQELLMMVLFVNAVIVGITVGFERGANYGLAGQIMGVIIGPIVTVMATFSLLLLCYMLIVDPFDRFWRWWRPYPPACMNGDCGRNDYKFCKLPVDVVERWPGLSLYGHQCQCGHVYAGGYDKPFRSRWVRVLPDGGLLPYLKHRLLGRWRSDHLKSFPPIQPVVPRAEIDFPRGTSSIMSFLAIGCVAIAATFRDLGHSSMARTFCAVVAVSGLLIGIVVEFFMSRQQK